MFTGDQWISTATERASYTVSVHCHDVIMRKGRSSGSGQHMWTWSNTDANAKFIGELNLQCADIKFISSLFCICPRFRHPRSLRLKLSLSYKAILIVFWDGQICTLIYQLYTKMSIIIYNTMITTGAPQRNLAPFDIEKIRHFIYHI